MASMGRRAFVARQDSTNSALHYSATSVPDSIRCQIDTITAANTAPVSGGTTDSPEHEYYRVVPTRPLQTCQSRR